MGSQFKGISFAVMVAACLAQTQATAQEGGEEQPQAGSVSPPSENWSISAGNVDLRTGTYVYTKTDLQIGSFSFGRTASSGLRGKHDLFGSFAHSYEHFVTTYQHASGDSANPLYETRTSVYIDGKPETFKYVSSGGYFRSLSEGSGSSLSSTSEGLKFRTADGSEYFFGGGGCIRANGSCSYLRQMTSPTGLDLEFRYEDTGSKRLREISSNLGVSIRLEYTSVNSKPVIDKACIYNEAVAPAPNGNSCAPDALQTVSYTYQLVGGRPRMASTTAADGEVWRYEHTLANGVLRQRFKRPGDSSWWLTNTIEDEQTPEFGENGKVTRQDFADDSYYEYSYMLTPSYIHGGAIEPRQIVGGSYSNAAGASWSALHDFPPVPLQNGGAPRGVAVYQTVQYYQYAITPGPTAVTPPHGVVVASNTIPFISNDYCDRNAKQAYPSECFLGPLQRQTMPEGNYREYWWQMNPRRVVRVEHHPKPNRNEPVLVETAQYNCQSAPCRAKPTRTTDANGNVSDFEYAPEHGGILKRTLPADANGVRPETRYSYEQKYAWLKSGSGYARAASPVWFLASEEYCRTSAADANGNCAAGSSDEVVTTYQYQEGSSSQGSNVLLLGVAVTADGQTLRTCYGYDDFGRRISETSPRAGLTECPA